MLTLQDSFMVGYVPNLIGSHFNGLEILAQLYNRTQGTIQSRVEAQLAAWPGKGPEVVAYVRQVEAALQRMDLPAPTPPQSIEEYFAWTETITKQIDGILALREDQSDAQKLQMFVYKWMHTFGTQLGDLLHTLKLLILVHDLLGGDPVLPFLTQQSTHLAQGYQATEERLRQVVERTAFLHTFPAPLQKAMHDLQSLFQQTPFGALEANNPARMGQWQSIVDTATQQASVLFQAAS